MTDLLGELSARSIELAASLEELLGVLGSLPYEVLEWPPALPVLDLVSRTENLASLCKDLSQTPKDRFALAPLSRVVALRDQVQTLTASAQALASPLAQVQAWGGVTQFDAAGGVVHTGSGNVVNLASLVGDLQTKFDAALESYLVVAAAVKPRGIGTLSAASRVLTKKAVEAEKAAAGLEKSLSDWTQLYQGAQSDLASVGTAASEAARVLEEVEKSRKTVDENATKASAAAAAIEETRAQAAALEKAVTVYQDAFDGFQTQLDRREAAIGAGNESLKSLNKTLADKQKAVNDLIAKAEEMLGGATTAGLASTYHRQSIDVGVQLSNARKWYYGSIVLLILSVGVALNLFSCIRIGLPALPTFSESTPTGTIAVQALSALGSRGLLVLPALLLAGFTAHRHSALFRLREEYSHKYAAAASVQGFKLQAPSYQEAIAAAVFAELLKNPAKALDNVRAEREGNSFLDRLILPRVDEALKKAAHLSDPAP